ncbi:hypothetical protein ElyMa_004917700, partial [Elysia marginata]
VLRRLLTFREVIYLDRMAAGQHRVMYSDNGDEIIIRTDSRSNIPSRQRTAYIQYEGVQAQVIHSDIGATNGVMHIISSTGDPSSAPIAAPTSVLVLTLNVIFARLIIIDQWR